MTEEQELAIYDAQDEYIENFLNFHGSTNPGWGVDDESVTTKLYGHKTIQSVSSFYNEDGNIEHQNNLHHG